VAPTAARSSTDAIGRTPLPADQQLGHAGLTAAGWNRGSHRRRLEPRRFRAAERRRFRLDPARPGPADQPDHGTARRARQPFIYACLHEGPALGCDPGPHQVATRCRPGGERMLAPDGVVAQNLRMSACRRATGAGAR
jgi:hypothetical protein